MTNDNRCSMYALGPRTTFVIDIVYKSNVMSERPLDNTDTRGSYGHFILAVEMARVDRARSRRNYSRIFACKRV